MRRPKWRSQVPILVLEWQERAARHAASIRKAGEIMAKTVEFLFDFVSPSSYLADMALPRIADRVDARVVWTSVHLGAVSDSPGSATCPMTAARTRWMADDASLRALYYGIALHKTSA